MQSCFNVIIHNMIKECYIREKVNNKILCLKMCWHIFVYQSKLYIFNTKQWQNEIQSIREQSEMIIRLDDFGFHFSQFGYLHHIYLHTAFIFTMLAMQILYRYGISLKCWIRWKSYFGIRQIIITHLKEKKVECVFYILHQNVLLM